jgi:hypothetical protein
VFRPVTLVFNAGRSRIQAMFVRSVENVSAARQSEFSARHVRLQTVDPKLMQLYRRFIA